MVCIYCGGEMKVANSRLQKRNNRIWRRRVCLDCGAMFTTHESIELEGALLVEQKDGDTKPFLPNLLLKELMTAMQDRQDVYTASGEVLSTIIRKLLSLPQKPVYIAGDISKATAEILKHFDKRAHLRYIAEHPSAQGRRLTL